MRRPKTLGSRLIGPLIARLGNVTTPADVIRTSKLFDADFVNARLLRRGLQFDDASAICDSLAVEPDLFDIDPGPLFDAEFYVTKYADVAGYRAHPFVHFVSHGFYEGRQPHPLIDLRYLAWAMRGTQARLETPDDLPGAIDTANPHPLFNNDLVRSQYGARVDMYRSPLEFYLLDADPPVKHASVWFSADKYIREHPEATSDGRDPLVEFAASGNDAMGSDSGLIIDGQIPAGVLSAHGIRPERHAGPIPWPTDAAGYATLAQVRNPYVSGPLPANVRLAIGVVLFQTDAGELDRLLTAIEREAAELVERTQLTLHIGLAVNDDRAETYRALVGGRRSGHPIDIVHSGGNIGFGAAHNRLMAQGFSGGSEHYLGLNPDGFPMHGCLGALMRCTTALADRALVEADAFPVGHPKWFDPVSLDSEWVSGAAFLMPSTIHAEVGGFDELFHMYCEDVDISWRVRDAGFRTVVCPTAQFYHDVAPRLDVFDPAATRAMFLSARLLGHKWGNAEFAKRMEDLLVERDLMARADLPALPELEPIDSAIPNFDYDLRFARSRFW